MVASRVRPRTGGWHDVIHMQPLAGVASETSLWHAVVVTLTGAELAVTVDGSPAATLVLSSTDGGDDFASRQGFVGLLTHCQFPSSVSCQSTFRNLTVEGARSHGR